MYYTEMPYDELSADDKIALFSSDANIDDVIRMHLTTQQLNQRIVTQNSYTTAIHTALQSAAVDLARYLITGRQVDLNQLDSMEQTVLMRAISSCINDRALITTLIEHMGAERINHAGYDGKTAFHKMLHLACWTDIKPNLICHYINAMLLCGLDLENVVVPCTHELTLLSLLRCPPIHLSTYTEILSNLTQTWHEQNTRCSTQAEAMTAFCDILRSAPDCYFQGDNSESCELSPRKPSRKRPLDWMSSQTGISANAGSDSDSDSDVGLAEQSERAFAHTRSNVLPDEMDALFSRGNHK